MLYPLLPPFQLSTVRAYPTWGGGGGGSHRTDELRLWPLGGGRWRGVRLGWAVAPL